MLRQRRSPSRRTGNQRDRPHRRAARAADDPAARRRDLGLVWPLVITIFAGFLRFDRLSRPDAVSFDETYYVKDAWSILRHGVEWNVIPNPPAYPSYLNY